MVTQCPNRWTQAEYIPSSFQEVDNTRFQESMPKRTTCPTCVFIKSIPLSITDYRVHQLVPPSSVIRPHPAITYCPLPVRQERDVWGQLERPLLWHFRSQCLPHLQHRRSSRRKHAILQTIQILSIDRWHELAHQETEQYPRSQIVFSNAVRHLKVLVEHGAEGQRDGLSQVSS